MHPRYGEPRFVAALAALLLSGQPALQLCKLGFALVQILWVCELCAIRGDGKGFKANINADHCARFRQRRNVYVGTAQRHKILATGVLAYRRGEDAPLYFFGDGAFHLSQLRKLHSAVQHFDGAVRFVALAMVAFTLKAREPRLFALLDTSEKVLVRGIQIFKRLLERALVRLPQPFQLLFECG